MNPEAGPQFDPSQQANIPNTREIMEEWGNLPVVEAEQIAKEEAAAAEQAEWEQKRAEAAKLLEANEGAQSSLVIENGVVNAKKSGKVTRVDEDGQVIHIDGKKLFKAATAANEAIGYSEGRSDRIEAIKAELFDMAEKAMAQGKTAGGERANDSIARGRALRAELSELTAAERTYNDRVSKATTTSEAPAAAVSSTETEEDADTGSESNTGEDTDTSTESKTNDGTENEKSDTGKNETNDTNESDEANTENTEEDSNTEENESDDSDTEETEDETEPTPEPAAANVYKTPSGKKIDKEGPELNAELMRLVVEGDIENWSDFVETWRRAVEGSTNNGENLEKRLEEFQKHVAVAEKLIAKNKMVFDQNPGLEGKLKEKLLFSNKVEFRKLSEKEAGIRGENGEKLMRTAKIMAAMGRRTLKKAGVQLKPVTGSTNEEDELPSLVVEDNPATPVAGEATEASTADPVLDADAPRIMELDNVRTVEGPLAPNAESRRTSALLFSDGDRSDYMKTLDNASLAQFVAKAEQDKVAELTRWDAAGRPGKIEDAVSVES